MQELSAKLRKELGKQVATLRRAGFLPAVVYGEGTESRPISVLMRDFEKVHREAGESSVVALNLGDSAPLNVMIHDVAYDALTGKPIHADFYSVRMDKEIETKVPLVFLGESPAVKNDGGVLVKVMHEIEVRALPQNLPHELTVDLSRLVSIGDRIHVGGISVRAGVVIPGEAGDVVVLVEAPVSEEAEVVSPAEMVEVKTEREAKVAEKAKKEEATSE